MLRKATFPFEAEILIELVPSGVGNVEPAVPELDNCKR
jgi:hypothetical protein